MFWRACPDLGSLREESFRWRRPGVRAVMMREFGPPEVLEPAEVAEVRAGPDEVVIGVEFANVTFVETQVRAGRPPHPSMLPALPAILGNGVGGTVSDSSPWSGLQVVASLNGTGGYAERAVTTASQLIRIPDGLATRDAVALLADGRTALALAGRAELRPGKTVLVEAAGGGVGTLLVQVARRAGARVVALAGQQRNAVGEVDVVFDGVGGDIGLAAFGLLGTGGRFCPFGMASGRFAPVTPELAQDRQVTVRTGAGGNPAHLAALARMALAEAAAGRLRPVIGQEFELADAARAHAAIEARETVGKTLLTVPR